MFYIAFDVGKSDKARFSKEKMFGPNLGILGPNLPKFQVFGYLLEFESLDFLYFAYYDRELWYVTGSCG